MTFWDGTRWRPEAPIGPRERVGRRTTRVRDLLATAAMILGLVAAVLPFMPAIAGAAILSLSPAAGTPGQTVTLTGSGFPEMTRLLVTWDGSTTAMPSPRVSRRGTFSTSFVVPSAVAGSHTVAVAPASSKSPKRTSTLAAPMAAVTFTLTTLLAAPTPTIATTPTPEPPSGATPAPTTAPTTAPGPSATTPPASPTPAPTATPTAAPTAPPPASTSGYVTRCGLGLCLNGAPYQFTGLNIYNANSRDNCWYPLGYADSKLGDSLTAIGSGQEVFRAWFFERLAGDWAAFDHTIAVAKAHNMRIIATLADQWGNCENESGSPIYKDVTWYQSGYKTAYRAHVQAIVSRYRNEPTILAWQLMNEAETKTTQAATVCPTNSLTILRDWAVDMSGLVKSIDPDTLVSIGTIGSGQCGAQGDEYRMLHSIPTVDLCEYHDYQPEAMAGDQWNGLAVRLTQCAGLGKPLFVGESGQKGLSREDRAALFAAKFSAQFDGGVSGILIWDWSNGPLSDGYEVLSGDPSVALFDRY